MRRMSCVATVVCILSLVVAAPIAAADPAPLLTPPVDGPIVEHFSEPATKFSAGQRGIVFATAPDEPVKAAAPGVVAFAGQVAGLLWVSIQHEGGLRTSYGPLRTASVGVNNTVEAGTVIGTSGGRLHFGLRRDGAYVDPEPMLVRRVVAHLVPTDEEAGLVIHRSLFGSIANGVGAVVKAAPVGVPRFVTDALTSVGQTPRRCTPDGVAPSPPAARTVILVAGFGSSSVTTASIDRLDTATLGLDASSVIRFSYSGGRVPGGDLAPDLASIPSSSASTAQSEGRLSTAAERLAALIDDVRRRRPDEPIAVIGHSQGGVVAVEAVRQLEGPQGILVITIGSPHQGASLAAAIHDAEGAPKAGAVLGLSGALLGTDPDSDAARDLDPASPFMAAYRHAPIPRGVAVTSIGGRWDPVVTAVDTRLEGADNIVVHVGDPLHTHADLPADPQTTREVALALAGLPPTCEALLDRLADSVAGHSVQAAERAIGQGAGLFG